MPPGVCFEIARNDRPLPTALRTCQSRTWIQVGPARWFWIAQDNTITSFDVRLNGKTIQENVELKGPTGGELPGGEKATGPLLLQGDHGIVAYRNIAIEPVK